MNHQPSPSTSALPLPPGTFGLPIVGETFEFIQSPNDFVNRRRAKYGEIFCSNILGANTVFLGTPEANRWIFSGENKYLVNKWSYAISRLLGAQGVAMLVGEAHAKRRAQLSPHFKHDAMAEFVGSIQKIAERHLENWANLGGETSIIERVRLMAFEIATVFIFGATPIDIPYLNRLFRDWTGGMFDPLAPLNLPFTPFGRALRAKQAMFDYLEPIIRKRMELAEQPFDILGSMISVRDENGQPLSLETILHEVQVQLFAGHDTTVTATSNLMMLLALHPDVLERARAEQSACAHITTFDLDSLKHMPYLEQVINEGLRFIPPVNGAFRMAVEDLEYEGYRIPKGWVVLYSPNRTHALPPWTEPQTFDPDRFSPERAEHKQKPFTFIPFGGGPRMCLGRNFAMVEMSIILALLLRHYEWELTPGQDLSLSPLPFPLPRGGLRAHFRRRLSA
ncbi:MAG: cytochrome P450 [Anaerolineae bacterium]|nr:MAG: cytochrome P450 [Anaerolineae bacterium]